MSPPSDDEFDDIYDYDESLEAEIQRLEAQLSAKPEIHLTRDPVTIAYETPQQQQQPRAGGKEEFDAPEVALSQSSAFEEELVAQVTELLHPETINSEEFQQAGPTSGPDADANVKIIPISLDAEGNLLEAVQITRDERSLFQRFRKREFFSVSDLVGPLWCEVQYD